VTVRDHGDRLNIGINGSEDERPLIATSLTLRRLPLTNRSVIQAFLRYPLVTHKTIAFIHWHALRLWLRGVPFRRHSTAPLAAHGAHR